MKLQQNDDMELRLLGQLADLKMKQSRYRKNLILSVIAAFCVAFLIGYMVSITYSVHCDFSWKDALNGAYVQ